MISIAQTMICLLVVTFPFSESRFVPAVIFFDLSKKKNVQGEQRSVLINCGKLFFFFNIYVLVSPFNERDHFRLLPWPLERALSFLCTLLSLNFLRG